MESDNEDGLQWNKRECFNADDCLDLKRNKPNEQLGESRKLSWGISLAGLTADETGIQNKESKWYLFSSLRNREGSDTK